MMEKERELIVEYGKKMSSQGLSHGTSGNLSIYDPATGYMAISPSGIGYFETEPSDIVVMDLSGNVIEGIRKPSSEYALHAGFYKSRSPKECSAIVHTHSDYATTLACMGETIKAVHYVLIAAIGAGEVPLCPYVTFGTPELAEAAVKASTKARAVLLQNHGVITWAGNIADAFNQAENIELTAKLQWQCMAAGKMIVLNDQEIEDALKRFGSYGQ